MARLSGRDPLKRRAESGNEMALGGYKKLRSVMRLVKI